MRQIGLGYIVICILDAATVARLNGQGGRKYATGEPIAGIVTRVHDNAVCNLTLFPDLEDTVFTMKNVPHSTTGNQPGTWTYPDTASTVAA